MTEIVLPWFEDISLRMSTQPSSGKEYSTSELQKGWLLCKSGKELSEEAVGFGVPVVQRGLTTVFPGKVDLEIRRQDSGMEVDAVYQMNLAEKIAGLDRPTLRNHLLYDAKHRLAAMYRRYPPLRSPLTILSSALRNIFRWRTVYEESRYTTLIRMKYISRRGRTELRMETDLRRMERDGVTEVAIMNEQGARFFARYLDSDGISLAGNKIDGWDRVTAEKASFFCDRHGLAFSLHQMPGARLFRGRELVGTRLAWSGFGYLLPPSADTFGFDLLIEKI